MQSSYNRLIFGLSALEVPKNNVQKRKATKKVKRYYYSIMVVKRWIKVYMKALWLA